MQTFKTLSDVIALAEFAHRNQTDKAGLPYIDHPRRVLAKVQAQGALPYVQMAAILHDVTEDTAFTPDILLELGVSEATVRIVRLLDRELSKKAYYDAANSQWPTPQDKWTGDALLVSKISLQEFYYTKIVEDPAARMVKLADIEDNLSPWRLSYLEPATQERLRNKYAKALEILNS